MLFVNESISIPETEFDFGFSRSSGPGGQNVNKVNSRATLRWDATRSAALPEDVQQRFLTTYRRRLTREGILQISSQRYRDQGRNVTDCLSKLRELILAVFSAPQKRKATRPSRGAQQRRLAEKRTISERKQSRRKPSGSD
jgi:ribosome-associated protein